MIQAHAASFPAEREHRAFLTANGVPSSVKPPHFHHRGPERVVALPPVPAPSPSPGALSASQVASYARQAGFPEAVIPVMVSLAYRESHFEPGAINASSGACGLWQIYPAEPGCTDPATNATLAYEKWRAAGLAPWGM